MSAVSSSPRAVAGLNGTFRRHQPKQPVASDLLPKTGECPIKRPNYDIVALDRTVDDAPSKIFEDGRVELASADIAVGFSKPAKGALLTYAHSWFAQGPALGHLLHSLALPGERHAWQSSTVAGSQVPVTRQLLTVSVRHGRAVPHTN